MKIQDALGNELKKDQTVVISVGNSTFTGHVVELVYPGVVGGRDGITLPGRVVIAVPISIDVAEPRGPSVHPGEKSVQIPYVSEGQGQVESRLVTQ